MAIPPDPILRAAVRWLEKLPVSGRARARALFTTVSEYSDLSPTQYDAGYLWLREVGLLEADSPDTPIAERVFDAAILHSQALWLPDAEALIQLPEELPADIISAAQALAIDEGTAFARLNGVWGKFNAAELLRIGTAGELALVKLLSAISPDIMVDHVARRSDGFGYDIAVATPSVTQHVEVKTTLRRGRLSFYLSRNEYQVMLRDPAWSLVAIRLNYLLEPLALATVPRQWIQKHVPGDRSTLGRWQSCRLDVPPDIPRPGLAIELQPLDVGSCGLLKGSNGWPGKW